MRRKEKKKKRKVKKENRRIRHRKTGGMEEGMEEDELPTGLTLLCR